MLKDSKDAVSYPRDIKWFNLSKNNLNLPVVSEILKMFMPFNPKILILEME